MQCHSYQQQCLYVQHYVPPYITPSRYAQAGKHLLANTQPPHQPPQNMRLSTMDINLKNIREWTILDSGASNHFLVLGAPVTNKQVAVTPIPVTLPDGDQVQSTQIGDLIMTQMPKSARDCNIIPYLASYSLISVMKLCKAGCEVSFTKWGIGVQVKYKGRLIITGSKYTRTGIWMVPLSSYPSTAT